MTDIPHVTGVLIRKKGEPRPPKYRRKPEPQGPFEEEAADAARAQAQMWQTIVAQRDRARPRRGRRR